METDKKKSEAILIIAFLQIFLVANTTFAASFFAGEANSEINYLPADSGELNLFAKSVLGFLSIKQFGSVSAADVFCCEKAKSDSEGNGAWCFDADSETKCDSAYSATIGSCANTQEGSFCQLGTCVYDNGLSCAENVNEKACTENTGVWSSSPSNEIAQCLKGCCTIGRNANFITQRECEMSYPEREFHPEINNEFSCLAYPLRFDEGACVLEGGDCRRITKSECDRSGGDFYTGFLCSDPSLKDLGVDCDAKDKKICGDNKVYDFNVYDVDSCGNKEGIAEACNYPKTGCIETSQDNSCRDLNCEIDRNYDGDASDSSDGAINGESWCIYEGSIGEVQADWDLIGSDTVGSEHFLARCNNGEVTIESPRNKQRKDICVEQVTEENGLRFSRAHFTPNLAKECVTYNPLNDNEGEVISTSVQACNENKHCIIKHIDVDDYFKFDVCVPKYPVGFDLRTPTAASGTCAAANQECTVIYRKDERSLFGEPGWKCIENCDCEDSEFALQMNNLCVSLGDCGSYINYVGKGTDNAEISDRNYGGDDGAPGIYSWTNYANLKNPVPGKFASEHSSEFITARTGNSEIESFLEEIQGNPEWEGTLGDIMGGVLPFRNVIGIAGGGIALASYLFGTTSTAVSPVVGAGVFTTTTSGVFGSGFVNYALSVTGFAILGAGIGGIVGAWVAQQLGVSGDAAQTLVYSGAALGAAYATQALSLTAVGGIGFVIIAWIQLSGWGKTEKRKVVFECKPWQAPYGGDDCDKCNNNPSGVPCTKYQCESLGKACKFINENSENQACESLTYETNPPLITPLVVETEGYEFQNKQERSADIAKSSGECIPEFTDVKFKLQTDENAECRWGFARTANYDDLPEVPVEDNYFTLNHTFAIGGFSVESLEAADISGDVISGITGDASIYIKCKDYFGNANVEEYAVNYCIHDGEDTTAPTIKATEPRNDVELANGVVEKEIKIWTNEPADCSYTQIAGMNYADMTPMSCLESDWLNGYELNGWPCAATLTELEKENKIYIKCKDKPWETDEAKRNAMAADFEYNLFVTENPLKVDSISVEFLRNNYNLNLDGVEITEINGGGDFSVKLKTKTSGGGDNGASRCNYEFTENPYSFAGTFGDRFSEISSEHKKENLNLKSGDYNVLISCEDAVKNTATANGKFKLNVDRTSPEVVRIFSSGSGLNILTSEDAKCYYRTTSCNDFYFTTKESIDGVKNATSMTTGFSQTHGISSKAQEYYVKCVDVWNNLNNCLTVSESSF